MSEKLEREVGELTVAVQGLTKQLEQDRDERKEHRKELNTKLDGHNKRLMSLEKARNWLAGLIAAVGGILGYKLGGF